MKFIKKSSSHDTEASTTHARFSEGPLCGQIGSYFTIPIGEISTREHRFLADHVHSLEQPYLLHLVTYSPEKWCIEIGLLRIPIYSVWIDGNQRKAVETYLIAWETYLECTLHNMGVLDICRRLYYSVVLSLYSDQEKIALDALVGLRSIENSLLPT